MDKVAVLGAGPAGIAMAARIASKGYDVSLFELPGFQGSADRVQRISEQGGVHVEGEFPQEFVRLPIVTTDAEKGLRGRDIYLIGVPGFAQSGMMKAVIPYLRRGSLVTFCSGSSGTLAAYKEFSGAGLDFVNAVHLAETVTMPQSARFVEDGRIKVALGETQVRTAAFPSRNTDAVLERLAPLIRVKRAVHCLDVGLNNPNFIIHPAPMVLNFAECERREGLLSLMNEGMTPAVLTCMDAVDQEKQALLRELEAEPIDVDSLYREFGSSPDVYRKQGEPFAMKRPDRIWPRYTKEDVPYGMVQMASLGDLLGVATPMCHAIVTILSVAEHVNYWEIGRTAEKLGLVGLSAAEIIAYVRSGHRGGNAP